MKTKYIVADAILPVVIKNTLLEELEKKGVYFDESVRNILSVTLVDIIVEYVTKNSFTMNVRCEREDCKVKTTNPEDCVKCKHNLDNPKEVDCTTKNKNRIGGSLMQDIINAQDSVMSASVNKEFSAEIKRRLRKAAKWYVVHKKINTKKRGVLWKMLIHLKFPKVKWNLLNHL